MLTKEDYKKYLDQMGKIEMRMIGVYSQCALLAEGEDLKNNFLSLVEDEKRHFRLITSLKELFL